jgi:hypothetical protein
MGQVKVTRLEPLHDPEAYERVMRILGNGLRRALFRMRPAPAPEFAPYVANDVPDDLLK